VANEDSAQQTATAQDDNPAVAADDDLIEKEWVDKAKKIVADTKSDPYKQEQEVSKLQADYLKKRWGKETNVPND
jgi:Txe/YoeB family toxin of Txe-Axe toxin-antitoxin module